ncbi:hypothetical protein DFA_08196 [Cavenderia fasciculata]|uniref:Uncharacterized protein n=1 Tax=Cavenderia fasciculata TaxID=261658 RepID=F4Q5F0_CACFS|nr:uncharacterized protein DFA_08196 [Cavenderia fasciculata]EGG17209.1 hypothetical protein DFA_08196 [Cavenderia fasciculata]|eukprot:XP_004355693.1 hypothetical protein DFA_08196 [Cavenderia fasciculata]
MGDVTTEFHMGKAVWLKGLKDQPQKDKFIHFYYALDQDGKYRSIASNGESYGELYVREIR